MDRGKNRRRAEKKYMRRTVIISAAAALGSFVLIGLLIRAYPHIQESRIRSFIRMGDYTQAQSAIASVGDGDTAQRLTDAIRYAKAEDMLRRGDYKGARETFLALGNYEDARAQADQAAYLQGEALYLAGDSAGAKEWYLLIPDRAEAGERLNAIRYGEALALADTDKVTAYRTMKSLSGYMDAEAEAQRLAMEITGEEDPLRAMAAMDSLSEAELSGRAAMAQARNRLRFGALAAGGFHTVGLKSDGSVLACGRNDAGQCDVQSWRGVTQIAAGAMHTAALLEDGTVVAAGDNTYGQCDTGAWRNVKGIACGDWATFALFQDGTVAAAGFLEYPDISAWRDVVTLRAGSYMAAGIRSDGGVYVTHPSGKSDAFAGLDDIALTTGGAVGLTYDGQAVATFDGFPGWTDTAMISCGKQCVLGIRSDGALLAHFFRSGDAFNAERFDNVLCVSAGSAHCAILTNDGQVWAFGDDGYGQCDVDNWILD